MKQMVEICGISKWFKNTEVLHDVNMKIYEGEIYGFLGENGAGKTTLMKLMLNLLKPDSGRIEIMGEAVERNSYQYLEHIGSMIEYPVFYEALTAVENLTLHCSYMKKGKERIPEVLSMTGLGNTGEKLVRDFSLGMKQRLGIARAIVTRPELLVLDEPVNGLDPLGIRDIRELIQRIRQKWGTTILISSHLVSELEMLADRTGILHNGCIQAQCHTSQIPDADLETYFLKTVRGGVMR